FTYDYNYASYGQQVLTQPDGSIFIILDVRGTGETRIAKRLSNGYVDPGYGTDGFSSPVNIRDAQAAMQPDGKIIVMGTLISGNITDFGVVRYNTDGTPDNTFGVGGMVTTDFGYGNNFPTSVALQNDGKIVVIGTAYTGERWDFALARYNTNGSPDNNFGEDGLQTTDLSNGQAQAVAIQADGKILVAGYFFSGINNDFVLVRYNTNGNLDSTFNEDGIQTTDFNSSDDIATSLSVQPDGKILIAGYNYTCGDTCSNLDFVIARYNTNGNPDSTFNGNGKQITDFYSFDNIAKSIAIQTDGKIIIGGYTYNGSNQDFAMCRYNINGSLDNTFNGNGKQTTEFGGNEYGNTVALQTNGKILIGGWDDLADFDLACYNVNGTPDLSFKGKGKFMDRMSFPDQGYTYYTSTAIQTDGKIITAGYTWNNHNFDFAIARYNPNGTLD
ncbi:MAG: Ig-like domain-containing protein, partial [Ginsengibacter sp.]